MDLPPITPLDLNLSQKCSSHTYKCGTEGYTKTHSEIALDVSQYVAESNNLGHNLVNVISGINHEVSPWLGGSINTLLRLRYQIAKAPMCSEEYSQLYEVWIKRIDGVLEALRQASSIMSTVSRNVKRLKQHSVEKVSLLNTVRSWFTIIFVNDTIKGAIEKSQIEIDEISLSFEVLHSPMLLTQVFLNLVKNSIDHNPTTLENLKIRIYGFNDELIIEDNGCGVNSKILPKLFVPEISTKSDGDIHGLGLAVCREYCQIMGADIMAENVDPHGLRLRITFAQNT